MNEAEADDGAIHGFWLWLAHQRRRWTLDTVEELREAIAEYEAGQS